MSSERKEYSSLPDDATGKVEGNAGEGKVGQAEGRVEDQRAEETRAAMRRSEALVQSMEDAQWEELMGGGAG
jgi:hypothetical protein